MKKALLLLLIFVVGCYSHLGSFNPKHNWAKSSYEKHDGVVAITVDAETPYCSGVVLTPNLVLTAGHCVDPRLHDRLYITSGCDNIRSETCTHTRAYMFVPNPGHRENGPIWNDLGVLKPETPIENVKPAKLATGFETESTIYLAGFGKRDGEKGGILYAGTSKIHHTWLYEFETYLNGVNGPCGGDSGSPAFDEDGAVIGILSRSTRIEGMNCGGLAKYVVPVMYIEWIQEMNSILNGGVK